MKIEHLVGSVIKTVSMNEDKTEIRFDFEDARLPLVIKAYGDCCSNSWFEHLAGFEALIGHKVVEVVDRPMPEGTNDPNDQYIQYYGWTIVTARGRADLEMRNSSNGYYGGWIEVGEIKGISNHFPVQGDF